MDRCRARLLYIVLPVMLAGCAPDHSCGVPPEVPPDRLVLLNPDSSAFKAIPPDTFHVTMQTSRGDIVIQVVREWSPMGAYRFYNLVRNGYYDGTRFFRVIPGFAAQFGVSGYPAVERAWRNKKIPGDPVRVSNRAGMVTFAQAGKNSRTTQLFINLADNPSLDAQNFAPIGRVVQGLEHVAALNGEYGELAPDGNGPDWRCLYRAGNAYLARDFPRLDSIGHMREGGREGEGAGGSGGPGGR